MPSNTTFSALTAASGAALASPSRAVMFPIKKKVSKAFLRSLNSTKKLMRKHGFLTLPKSICAVQRFVSENGLRWPKKQAKVFCVFLEHINEELVRNFQCIYKALKTYNTVLIGQDIAYQQFVYYIKLCSGDKHLWKKLFPCLSFGRSWKEQRTPWTPPPLPKRKKKKKLTQNKKVDTLPFLLSFYKLLKQARENNDRKGALELMSKFRASLPFGSTAFLLKSMQSYTNNNESIQTLRKEQRKLRFCSFVKIGQNRKERMAEEHFCVKHRRYISKFRVPEKNKENSMETLLERVENPVESSESEDDDW